MVGPSLLQWRFAAILANVLTANFPQSGITFGEKFEDTAVVALTQGHADFALIPAAAVNASLPTGIEVLPLGTITMQLVAANSHPIIAAMSDVQRRKPRVSAATVLKHEFACPNHWQFCGIDQGARSDGWRDDKLPPPRSILDRRYATSNSPSAQRPSANMPARFCTNASATQPPARKRLRLRLHRTSLFNVATEYCKWLAGSLGCELA